MQKPKPSSRGSWRSKFFEATIASLAAQIVFIVIGAGGMALWAYVVRLRAPVIVTLTYSVFVTTLLGLSVLRRWYRTFRQCQESRGKAAVQQPAIATRPFAVGTVILAGLLVWIAITREKTTLQFQGSVWSEKMGSRSRFDRATPEELLQARVEKRAVHLYDVPRAADNTSIIRGKTFEQCLIVGPCLIAMTGRGSVFWDNTFCHPPGDVDALFVKVPKGTRLVGVIGVDGCIFRNCIFDNVAFFGDDEFVQAVKKGTRL